MSDLSFPDLRAFLDQLRRDSDLAVVEAEVDPRLEAAEIHRRVIAAGGPALAVHEGPRRGPAARHQPLRHRSPRPARLRHAAGAARQAARPPRRDADAADRRQALGRAGRRPGGAAHRPREARARAGDGGRDPRRAPRPPARPHLLARGRRPLRHAAPRLHGAPRPRPAGSSNLGMYRLHVHDARTTGMHWQIGKGGGFHHAVAEARGESLPVTVFLGGPPALVLAAIAPLPENVPELMLASLIAGRRLERCPGPGAHPLVASAEIALVGHVPARVRQAEGPFGDHYGYLLAAARLPRLPRGHALPAPRRDLPRHRRRQAAPGGLLHRGPAAGAAGAALPARDARGRGPLVLRGDGLPLARGRGREGALQA